MSDAFENNKAGLTSPAENAAAVTPADDTDLATSSRALWIGTAGDVEVDMVGGETEVVFSSVPAGTLLPIRVSRVRDANTTASNIVAVW
tara:strand:- start:3080 stop:3346 length:267 start_codon:yes stop_codon:yes gene_type:complete